MPFSSVEAIFVRYHAPLVCDYTSLITCRLTLEYSISYRSACACKTSLRLS
jgi:hypothetical protein